MSTSQQSNSALGKLLDLPSGYKVLVVSTLALILMALGYFVDSQMQQEKLTKAQTMEATLKTDFEAKYARMRVLQGVDQHNKQLQAKLAQISRSALSESKIDQLLKRISRGGIAEGLKFIYFKPQKQKIQKFYTITPIEIAVVGNYHQIARYMSQITNLNHMLTINSYNIKRGIQKGSDLKLEITVDLYRPSNTDKQQIAKFKSKVIHLNHVFASNKLNNHGANITMSNNFSKQTRA